MINEGFLTALQDKASNWADDYILSRPQGSRSILVPPIKCQGIKTKLVPNIRAAVPESIAGRWIEPFCGSCVVALNIQPKRALLADTNRHIIALYQSIQNGTLTPSIAKQYLRSEGQTLKERGNEYYYEVRARFNATPNSLDFLFLNRACFNGVMRFNRKGGFNVPFGNKLDRFRPAYVTKIVNQIKAFKQVVDTHDWQFVVADFHQTVAEATPNDFLYVDPPYAGRHTDYFNQWRDESESDLIGLLQQSKERFLLSTWHHNRYRENVAIDQYWQVKKYSVQTVEHFYHVGATEDLRNSMTEALIANYELPSPSPIATDLPHIEPDAESSDTSANQHVQPTLF